MFQSNASEHVTYTIIIHCHANDDLTLLVPVSLETDCIFVLFMADLISNINIWMQSIKVNHAKDIKAKRMNIILGFCERLRCSGPKCFYLANNDRLE